MTAFAADELRDAIERDQLFLLFQPQVDLATGRPRGVEAMLRWGHPRLGVVHAAEFVGKMAHVGLDRHASAGYSGRLSASSRSGAAAAQRSNTLP